MFLAATALPGVCISIASSIIGTTRRPQGTHSERATRATSSDLERPATVRAYSLAQLVVPLYRGQLNACRIGSNITFLRFYYHIAMLPHISWQSSLRHVTDRSNLSIHPSPVRRLYKASVCWGNNACRGYIIPFIDAASASKV